MPSSVPSRPHAALTRRRSIVSMATVVTIEVVLLADDVDLRVEADRAIDRACAWFDHIEATCSRFLPDSEVMQLTSRIAEPVPASALLFESIRFSRAVADASGGAFDPTVGVRMAGRGFDREHRTGCVVDYGSATSEPVSFRDVAVDVDRRTVTLRRPLVLDLGGIAKGLAVDMAARELAPHRHFAIDAGGDLYLSGLNPRGEAWSVGIRHPRQVGAIIETVQVSDAAFCTSGDYERRAEGDGGHHIVDPRTGESPTGVSSASVKAPTTMVADALATAAFVLGARDGAAFLEAQSAAGILYADDLTRTVTRGFE
jgi:thiamine biosynthesis lipoprotein